MIEMLNRGHAMKSDPSETQQDEGFRKYRDIPGDENVVFTLQSTISANA
jgi:hypothetical protein